MPARYWFLDRTQMKDDAEYPICQPTTPLVDVDEWICLVLGDVAHTQQFCGHFDALVELAFGELMTKGGACIEEKHVLSMEESILKTIEKKLPQASDKGVISLLGMVRPVFLHKWCFCASG